MTRRTIHPGDGEWPTLLTEMSPLDPPRRLRVEGLQLDLGERAVAVVGARHPTASGLEATRDITRGLVEAGFTIVSGLAMGIDAAAHRSALQFGGSTVAVLGCGLDVDYPRRNSALRREIVDRGTLLTEYDDGTAPTRFTFPRRNRIIAGVSRATVFVEGGEKSGGRITARCAADMGRSVFAVPGSLRNPMSVGPNVLIRRSEATLVTGVHDILEELAPGLLWESDPGRASAPKLSGLDDCERAVLLFLEEHPVKPERVRRDLELTLGQTALALTRLEARGWVLRRPGGFALTDPGARARFLLEDAADA